MCLPKEIERSLINSIAIKLKDLDQREADTPKQTRWQETIKLRVKINKIEIRGITQRINDIQLYQICVLVVQLGHEAKVFPISYYFVCFIVFML